MAILVRQNTGTGALDTTATSVAGAPTGTLFSVNSSNTNSPSLAASLTSSISGSTHTTALPASADTPISSTQPVSLRALIAISVAAFILIAGAVLFVLWFGSRARQTKDGPPKDDHVEYSHESTAEDVNVNLKGMPPLPSTLPTKKSMGSGRTSNYSQSTAQNPPLSFHQRKSTADSWDPKPPRSVHTYDAEPIQLPQNAAYNISMYSQQEAQSPYSEGPAGTSQQSPRSAYAQAITHPYTIGAHPYASPSLRPGPSQSRPSIEHNGNYSVAMAAAPESDGVGLGLSGHSSFAGAGTRPGYDAYGIESRQPVALNTRPSLESVRSLAKKQSLEKVAVATATDFAIGGPQAVGSRSRQNSITSSIRQGNGSMAPSIRSRKDSAKEKRTKEERAREMAAMDNLIAALDESAAKERKRKESLAAAAGLNESGSAPGAGSGSTSRRKEVAVTGSYPLPPAEVFRKALSSAGRPSTDTNDIDDIDDEEIERWRRK